jgi:hypothetical protein
MSYCTVQEAWGTDFGRSNVGGFKAPVYQDKGTTKNSQENFTNYDETHESVNFPEKKECNTKRPYQDPIQRQRNTLGNQVPSSYSDSTFYPLDSEVGKEHVLNYSYDYQEEEQLNGKATPQQCSSTFKHLTECKECRQKLINSIDKTTQIANVPTLKTESGSGYFRDFDATELALFIACGVFFIFLLDAIVKLAQRFK